MADTRWLLHEGFNQRFEELLKRHPSLDRLTEEEALRLGREAADAIAGPVIWRELLGEDRLDTTNVAMLLGITRQAVHKKVKAHALFGVAGRGITWFPSWQFDIPKQHVRHVVPALLAQWAKAGPDGADIWDPLAVLSWAGTPQQELGEQTPEEWIASAKEDQPVLDAAYRAAKALSM
jgi:hypothetical protein